MNENAIISTRIYNQQLADPVFSSPVKLVSHMGAIQAQDYQMAKWAIGIRLCQGTLQDVEEALQKGDIIRTHILRPTWHFITAEDLPWMLSLCSERIKAAHRSYTKHLGITSELYKKAHTLICNMLKNHNHLTKTEIEERLRPEGIPLEGNRINYFLQVAEAEGTLCSGKEKEKKHTYALLEERIPCRTDFTKEEALGWLALKYFKSHGPATMKDFI